MIDAYVAHCTFPDEQVAKEIAGVLIDEGLAACVNLVPQVQSVYRWQGQVCTSTEVLGLIKTTSACLQSLEKRLLALHPYDCPEFICFRVADGSEQYLRWIQDSTRLD